MPETHPPTRTTENPDTPHVEDASEAMRRHERTGRRGAGRFRDPRAHDVGLDSPATEDRSRGVGFAEEIRAPDTEHKTGRDDEGNAT
ncbi:MAG TPA: hypothetical protein VF212_15815 [Longimicrobiales bacterium]